MATVGREQPEAEGARLRVVDERRERGLVVGAQERLGVPDAHAAEGARDVVDEELQRLRDRRLGDAGEEVAHLEGRPAGVEAAPQRARAEPVDRGAAARLDVGEQVQPARHLGLERTRARRRSGRPAAGRGRPARGSCGSMASAAAGRSSSATRRPLGGRPPAPLTPSTAASSRAAADEVGEDRRPARSQPVDPLHDRGDARPDGEHLAVGHLGQHPQREPARLLGEPARQLGRERVPRLAGRVAGAHQRRDAAARQPPADQPRPPLGRWAVRTTRRTPRSAARRACRRARLPSAISPADCATSTIRAAPASSTWSSRATALRSRTASPPLRSTLGGCTPQWSSSSSTRRTTSKAAPAAVRATSAGSRAAVASPGTSSTGSVVVRPPRRASPTSPGSTTVSPSRGTRSRRLISSSAGLAACSGRDRTPGRAGRALAAVGVDVAQQRGRRGAQLGQQRGHARRARAAPGWTVAGR